LFRQACTVLAHFKVQVIECVVLAWHCWHVIRNTTIFEASASVRPAISRRLLVNGKLNSDADRFHHFVAKAGTTLASLAFNENGICFTCLSIINFLRVLLPQNEIKSRLRVLLLPAELGVLCQLAKWAILYLVVFIDDLAVGLGAPVQVQAERFGVT